MATAFEELPPARETPLGNGRIFWDASFLVTKPDGDTQSSNVKAVVHQDKASELRLRQERRGHLMCGMLVDATGMVYGISSVYIDGMAAVEDESPIPSQVDVARARLIDLASEWRKRGATYGPGAGVLVGCASELDEITVTYLSNHWDTCPNRVQIVHDNGTWELTTGESIPSEAEQVCPSLHLDYDDLFTCTATGEHDVHRFNALKWTDAQAVPSPWPVDREPPAGITLLEDQGEEVERYLVRVKHDMWKWSADRDGSSSNDAAAWEDVTMAAEGDLIVVRP
jgi:hypothetical protein